MIKLKQVVMASIISVMLVFSTCSKAGEINFSCSQTSTTKCAVTAVATLDYESLTVTLKSKQKFYWCNGWGNEECYLKGTFVVLNKEFSIDELADNEVMMFTSKNVLSCFRLFSPAGCTTGFK